MQSLGSEEDTWESFRNAVWEKALKIAALPPSAQAIPVTKFCPSYLATLTQTVGAFTEVDQVCLAVIFSDHGEQEEEFPTVTKKQLELFLKRFGPPDKSLIKIRDLLQNGKVWFHGKQSRVASERLLAESKQEGAFLLRYSSLEGAFTVDYIKQGKVCHFNNIKNDPQGGVCVFVGKTPETQKAYKFTSMAAFISKNSHIFVVPCLNPRSHFQWLKLRIPKLEEEKAEASSSRVQEVETDESELDPKVPVEEKVKNAIQNSFRRNKTTLSLRNIGIGPALPTHICNLTYVVFLDLGKNKLTELPEELKNLKSLKTLNVSSNKLTALPSVIFTQFPRLTSLLASENEITHIPDTLYTVQTINYIDLSQNKLSRISPSIGDLIQLDFLDLGSNELTEIPPSIGKLEKLEELVLKQNRLTALPPQLASLQSLVILDISENQITHLPKELLDLMMENSRFGINTTGNPLAREDEDIIKKAKLRVSQMKGDDGGGAHYSRDILGLLQIPQDKDKTWSRAATEQTKKKRVPLQQEEGGPIDSMWVNAFGFVIEEGQGLKRTNDLTLQEHINYYDYHRFFYQKTVHANIIGNDKHLGAVCISIQKEPMAIDPTGGRLGGIATNIGSLITPRNPTQDFATGYYRVLIRTKQGDRRLEISTDECRVRKKEQYAKSEDLLGALKRMLKPTFNPKSMYVIRDHRSHREFAELEDKLMSNSSKFGLIYARDGQDETEMYNNEHGSAEFEEFLELLGERIDMKDWPNYRGDLSNKVSQKSLYTKFKDQHEIMFHVSTYLPFQQTTDEFGQQIQRKRYIGNDIVVIVYYEGTTPIDPNTFVSNFNHVFAMVQPVVVSGERHYKLHMAYKVGVAESKPRLPEDPVFNKTEIRDFLLTKLINAERCAMSATQFRRPQEHVRSELFKALQEKFPKQTMSTWSLHRSKDTDNSGYHSLTKEEMDKLLQTAQNQKNKDK